MANIYLLIQEVLASRVSTQNIMEIKLLKLAIIETKEDAYFTFELYNP